jgi:PAS domain S-box-containing protein
MTAEPSEVPQSESSPGQVPPELAQPAVPDRAREARVEGFGTFADRIFVDHAIDGFFLIDDQGHILDVNRHACESLGYSREELIGMHPRDFDVGLDEIGIERLMQRVAAGEMLTFETSHRRKDGTVFPVEIRTRECEQNGRRLSVNLVRDISERKRAEGERSAHLWVLASLDRVNQAMQGTNDVEMMMSEVLGAVQEIFGCDRAWLLYPCNPSAASYRVVMERTNPEFPGAYARGIDDGMTADFAAVAAAAVAAARASDAAVPSGPGHDLDLPQTIAQRFNIKSRLVTAVYPKIGEPYLLGMHQCSRARVWTPHEQRLFQEMGRRLGDALTSRLTLRSLRESEHRLDEAQRIAHVGYWDRELQTGFITLSDEACRIFGMPPGGHMVDLAQWHERWLELIHPEDRPRVAEAAAAALRGGAPYDVEYRIVHPHREVRIIHSLGEVTTNQSGSPRRMFGTMQDITELRRAEQEQRASETRLRLFMDHATDAFFLFDEQLTVLDVNRQACESLGYSREELIGMRTPDFDPCVTEADLAQLRERTRAGDTPTFESYHRRKDGTTFPVEVRGRVLEQHEARRYIATARDITERKRAEEAMLEGRVAERTRIARDLHDTLLQNFQGVLLQLRAALRLLATQPSKAREVLANTIDQAAQAIKEGREAVQGLRTSPESTDLGASIARLGKELAAECEGAALAVAVTVEGAVRPLRPNLRYEVFQAAAEALRNAFKHSRGTRIEVELWYEARHFRLRIRDDGRGINPNVVASGGRDGHFGLRGMHERAALVGGKLTVWSAPDSGTEIELIVPASAAYAAAGALTPFDSNTSRAS